MRNIQTVKPVQQPRRPAVGVQQLKSVQQEIQQVQQLVYVYTHGSMALAESARRIQIVALAITITRSVSGAKIRILA